MTALRFSYRGIKVNLAYNLFYRFKFYIDIEGTCFSSLFGVMEEELTKYGGITTDTYRHIENETKQMIENVMKDVYKSDIYIVLNSIPEEEKLLSLSNYCLIFDLEFTNPSCVNSCIDAFGPFIRYLNFAPFHSQHEKIMEILKKKNIPNYYVKIFHNDELVSPGFFIDNVKIGDHKTVDFSLMNKLLFKNFMNVNQPDITLNIPVSYAIDMFHELVYTE